MKALSYRAAFKLLKYKISIIIYKSIVKTIIYLKSNFVKERSDMPDYRFFLPFSSDRLNHNFLPSCQQESEQENEHREDSH